MARKKGQAMVETTDEAVNDLAEAEVATVGQRLRIAREKKGLSLEDVAAQTRIPRRHLESLETSDWERLPAPTYTNGFAKSYATVVGLDRVEIGEQLRGEMGGMRPTTMAEVFEPADPARTMPKWLVFGAIAAVVLLVAVMSWLSQRSVQGSDETATDNAAALASAAPSEAVPAVAQPAAQGAVVITANEPVWIQVKDGATTLKAGVLEAGQSFEIPATATAPKLTTGKPEGLRIAVGTADAPPVGPAATTVRNVSLLAADLMRGPPTPAAAAPTVRQAPPGNPPAPATPPVVENTTL
ncbi:RodZ domain-containing protein [Sphingomonas sp.]|uniref:helix-turn-helix domain-containing protein n=1 Tax=Sphingomonas sp. TaxID=28214 RepID=UPI00286C0EEC|nr:RodZ domain-containing protein [Sphingomonas sp.]